jgi:hypothetical protein
VLVQDGRCYGCDGFLELIVLAQDSRYKCRDGLMELTVLAQDCGCNSCVGLF